MNFDEPGGLIQCICMDGIDIICHDEGKLRNFPYNRVWVDDEGHVLDIFAGNIMCVRHNSEGEFVSIKESDRVVIEKHLVPIDEIIYYDSDVQYEKAILPIMTLYEESTLPEWSENE